MADNTTGLEGLEQRRIERIKQLRARLQREAALLTESRRRARNRGLYACGVLVERLYMEAPQERDFFRKKAADLFPGADQGDSRVREGCLSFFDRMDQELQQGEKEKAEGS